MNAGAFFMVPGDIIGKEGKPYCRRALFSLRPLFFTFLKNSLSTIFEEGLYGLSKVDVTRQFRSGKRTDCRRSPMKTLLLI